MVKTIVKIVYLIQPKVKKVRQNTLSADHKEMNLIIRNTLTCMKSVYLYINECG
jgi:hypothetical protein